MGEESFVRWRGFASCGPEETFVQMANSLSLLDTIRLGFELCGFYAHHPNGDRGFMSSVPLTSTSKLSRFVDSCQGAYGVKNARRALRCIKDGSASPMETAVHMLLCLSPKLGGFGFPSACLNYRVNLSERARKIAQRNYVECDLYWPAVKCAVEYDSDEFHASEGGVSRDARKRAALLSMGITVITLTKNQVYGMGFSETARLLAKRLGYRVNPRSQNFERKHLMLRNLVLYADAPGVA